MFPRLSFGEPWEVPVWAVLVVVVVAVEIESGLDNADIGIVGGCLVFALVGEAPGARDSS